MLELSINMYCPVLFDVSNHVLFHKGYKMMQVGVVKVGCCQCDLDKKYPSKSVH